VSVAFYDIRPPDVTPAIKQLYVKAIQAQLPGGCGRGETGSGLPA